LVKQIHSFVDRTRRIEALSAMMFSVNVFWFLLPAAVLISGWMLRHVTARRWAAIDTPHIATGHVTMGRIEVQGAAQRPGPLAVINSPLSGRQCAWWKVEVDKESGSGKNKSWSTQHTASAGTWISVDDGSGPILVDIPLNTPTNPGTETFRQSDLPTWITSSQLDEIAGGGAVDLTQQPPSYEAPGLLARLAGEFVHSFAVDTPISQLGGNWRVIEHYIELGSPVYVIGSTTYEASTHRTFFQQSEGKPLFVYGGAENQLLRNTRWLALGALVALIASTFFTCAVWRSDRVNGDLVLNIRSGVTGVVVLLVAAFVSWLIRIRVAATHQQVRSGSGLVDIALAKRSQLIPNLVAVVQASTTHTESLLSHLTELRTSTQSGAEVMGELRMTAERYPQLSTSANYLQLQQTLSDVETDLAVAHGFVADADAVHRTRIQSFPDSLIAKLFRVG
jgi:LemA protein